MPAKPASKATKPASKAASNGTKPASRATSAKPASSRAPSSRRGAAPEVIKEVAMPEEEGKEKTNGDAAAPAAAPAKKGRVAELNGQAKPKRARTSLAAAEINPLPQKQHGAHKTVFVFGEGSMGQHGMGPSEDDGDRMFNRPRLHQWLQDKAEDGTLASPGESVGGIEEIACGGMHTLAIDEAGNVLSWGVNDGASLGRHTVKVAKADGSGEEDSSELEAYPYVIESLKSEEFRAVRVAAGDSVSVALSDTGKLRYWGSFRGDEGILGFDGDEKTAKRQFTPIGPPALANVPIAQVAVGADHILALTTSGQVFAWGNGSQAQLGRRTSSRSKLNGLKPSSIGLKNVGYVAAGQYHSFAIQKDGTVWGWGSNQFNQLGVASDPSDDGNVPTPIKIASLSPEHHNGHKVVEIGGGEHHSLFLFDNGEVWATGRQDGHQCGIAEDHPAQAGLEERRNAIREERRVTLEDAKKKLSDLEAKEEPTDEDDKADRAEEVSDLKNEVAAAEFNLKAALDEFIPEPVRVYFPEIPDNYDQPAELLDFEDAEKINNPIAHIAAGTRHNLAVGRSGHAYSWGMGVDQQLGQGAKTQVATPTVIRSKFIKEYSALAASAGGQHCAILAVPGNPYERAEDNKEANGN